MELEHGIAETRERVRRARTSGATIGYMVTTGGLHSAHAQLLEALAQHADYLVVSNMPDMSCPISAGGVNHTTLQDALVCKGAGVSLLYAPSEMDVYGTDRASLYNVTARGTTASVLCGRTRPHIYSNIATHVLRMFNIVQPDVAVFGEKDYQQFQV